jgi:peptide-methionine (S)-S-oxide reductase
MQVRTLTLTAALIIALGGALSLTRTHAETAVAIPAPALDAPVAPDEMQTAVLAGGCFWGIQAVYQHTKGVTNAVSGYAGGSKQDADYRAVSTGRTGHAEAVQVTFDPHVISYGKILQIYFSVAHDPTQLDRQGPDTGPQYRSEIFAQDDAQQKIAKAYVAQLDAAKVFPKPIVTKIGGAQPFYAAEDYHQDYATKHPNQPYIARFDLPKIENLKQMFADGYRDKPVLVADAKPGH